ncbi:uncharacterized protein LOC128738795 [Sabethes cyaneus]|uniref:uncharacterized protein LOC128738795 n=1 Tax=Sabethes cyaneus TaxID=53552 RepID=UPI00237E1BB5|nr:uncharacterized protein LOC128738795 [Sabethes cyaneus]
MIYIRGGKRFMAFECSDGFTLIGEKYMVCKGGRWDTPAPMCVKPGCIELPSVKHGFYLYGNDKAAASVYCSSGFQPVGSLHSFCNGTHWDRTIGKCQLMTSIASTSCDFEVVDWCGWTNEPTQALSWKRSSGTVSMQALKTGPKQDHTVGVPLNGHFMIVDSTEQVTNASARLLSPIYPANYSLNSCFRFFYHMYGNSVGSLAVYLEPTSALMSEKQTLFYLSGRQGNVWKEGYFDLPEQTTSFQLVIEATPGMRFGSDIAIDDIELINNARCLTEQRSTSASSEVSASGVTETFDNGTCKNRCGQNASISTDAKIQSVTQCSCIDQCMENQSCCLDFVELCVLTDLDEKNETLEYSSTPASDFRTSYFNESFTTSVLPSEYLEIGSSTETMKRQTDRLLEPPAVMTLAILILIVGLLLTVTAGFRHLKCKSKEHSKNVLESIHFLAADEEVFINDNMPDELM